MRTKEMLAGMLMESGDEFLSGSAIAEKLNISRAAVWKNIKTLEKEGYEIEAVTNKGYRLSACNDVVDNETVSSFLGEEKDFFDLEVFESINSTNTYLKEKAGGLGDWAAAVSAEQTEGRGRIGRKFYSPAGTGVYLSVLLKEGIQYADAGRLTTAAAVAACRAIERCTDADPRIKWVNDVFVNDKKVCGILTEASVNYETGTPEYVVVGIGFNVYEPAGGFPEELADIAGAITGKKQKNLRSRIAAAFLSEFRKACRDLNGPELYNEYKKSCFIIGKPVYVLKRDQKIPAFAYDIREDFALMVRYEDGREEALNAGEISIRQA